MTRSASKRAIGPVTPNDSELSAQTPHAFAHETTASVSHATSTERCSQSAVQRTPPEVLCEIFRWTSLHGFTRKVECQTIPVAPWMLSHVSQSWRDAARGDGSLWSHIKIQVYGTPSHKYPLRNFEAAYPFAALEAQIHLSGTIPLFVEFYAGADCPDSRHSKLEAVLDLLLAHSNRWEQVIMHTEACSAPLRALSGLLGRLDRLACLDFRASQWPVELLGIFVIAPSLREVVTPCGDLLRRDRLISLPWHQITKLHLTDICSFDTLIKILRQTQNLVECVLDGYYLDAVSCTQTLVTLPHLRVLTLSSPGLTSCLIAPKLLILQIELVAEHIPDFLHRSGNRLRQLVLISSYYCNPGTIIAILSQAYRLTDLDVFLPSDSNTHSAYDVLLKRLFPALTFTQTARTSRKICPNLTRLCIDLSYLDFTFFEPNGPVPGHFCDMLESRWNIQPSARSLRTVHISPPWRVPRSIWRRLEIMRGAGLDVKGYLPLLA
ncbi:hypothetical protein R3P38DRAFT_696543 [Favolaschia claudopus]|uniref:F-box domain-containing protein n=1 Tax=Favolaschia claudopus TaxID=2862362 RepID=A0AAW0EE94_9AGAR